MTSLPNRYGPVSTIILVAAMLGVLPAPIVAQALDVAALDGNWVRKGSNYDPNDQMRIEIRQGQAKLLRVPATVSRGFGVGVLIWESIASDGSLRVRGSDGGYYPATLKHSGNELRLTVANGAAGNAQVWQRAGPTIDGDWVRIDPTDPTVDGMRLAADQDRGVIRFLPAQASRRLRIGSRLWQGVGAGGAMQVLTASGRYEKATLRLQGNDTLWVDATGVAAPQLWVRPALAASARSTFTANAAASAPVACVATSLPASGPGLTWGWNLTIPDVQTTRASQIGLLDYRGGQPGATSAVTDLEMASFPGLADGFARVWQRVSRRNAATEETGLTGAELRAHDLNHQARGGRLIDVAVYRVGAERRFAGVWMEDPLRIGTLLSYDLTSAEFGREFTQRRGAGYRLVDMEVYHDQADELRYATIWHASCDNSNWREVRGMPRPTLLHRIDSLGALGFRVVDLESYRAPSGQRYAAIWEQVPDLDWKVASDLDLPGFLNKHHRYTDLGFRLHDFESYATAAGTRYAGIWIENDPRYRLAVRQQLEDSVSAYRTRFQIPGISVAIIRNGAIIYQGGFGFADMVNRKDAYSGTVYPLASVSKTFGGVLAARLEARGVVDLTRPARDYVDSLPAAVTPTLEQILSKTGCTIHYGEYHEPPGQYYRWRRPALRSIEDSLMLPGCTPGRRYHYSTHGFTLLGAALEAATGQDIVELLDQEIFRPMALRSARPLEPTGTAPPEYHLSEGYAWNPATQASVVGSREDASWKILGGGLEIDAPDLARFGWLTLNGSAVSPTVRDNNLWRVRTRGLTQWPDTTRGPPPTALAWEVGWVRGHRVAEHGGMAINVGRSYLTVFRDDSLVVAVLSNQTAGVGVSGHPVRDLAHTLAGIVLASPPAASP